MKINDRIFALVSPLRPQDPFLDALSYVHEMMEDKIEIDSMKLIELKVVEHHEVYTGYEPADTTKPPVHDGYVLQDNEGEMWHCNYPQASPSMSSLPGESFTRAAANTEFMAGGNDFTAIKKPYEAVSAEFVLNYLRNHTIDMRVFNQLKQLLLEQGMIVSHKSVGSTFFLTVEEDVPAGDETFALNV